MKSEYDLTKLSSRRNPYIIMLRCEGCGMYMSDSHYCIGGLSRKESLEIRLENTTKQLKELEK